MERADKLLWQSGMVASRTLAQKLIREQAVEAKINGQWQPVSKIAQPLAADTEFQLKDSAQTRYVSRAGLKLEGALRWLCANTQYLTNPLERCVTGLTALDIGQSTGGFTDCLLAHGAQRVVGVDVGHDQLVPQLRNDPRVCCLEGINARDLPVETLKEAAGGDINLIVMDVSFISQTLILPALGAILRPGGILISLVKPQFELGREAIGKNGLVKPAFQGKAALENVVLCAKKSGFDELVLTESAVPGADGNQEYFLTGCFKPSEPAV